MANGPKRTQRRKFEFQERAKEKRENAQDRATYRGGITNSLQIERLNKRLGKGVGAKKERKRLTAAVK